MQGNDLIPIIIGAALGGLVVIGNDALKLHFCSKRKLIIFTFLAVLSGYFKVQIRLKKKRAENDRENLIEQ